VRLAGLLDKEPVLFAAPIVLLLAIKARTGVLRLWALLLIPIALSVVGDDDWMIRMLAYAAVVLSRSPPSVTGGRRVPR
jgi:hypothetical protein